VQCWKFSVGSSVFSLMSAPGPVNGGRLGTASMCRCVERGCNTMAATKLLLQCSAPLKCSTPNQSESPNTAAQLRHGRRLGAHVPSGVGVGDRDDIQCSYRHSVIGTRRDAHLQRGPGRTSATEKYCDTNVRSYELSQLLIGHLQISHPVRADVQAGVHAGEQRLAGQRKA